jgi:RNA polymerase sigma-70 factor, ECF subfamily
MSSVLARSVASVPPPSAHMTRPAMSSATDQIDDAALLQRLRAGDNDAFEQLVRRHTGAMLAVARRLLRDDDAARDAVQEAFLNAFKGLRSFREDASLSTWLHRIVVNAALMNLRRQKRRAETAIDELLPQFTETGRHTKRADPWRVTAESLLLDREARAIVRAAIDQLPTAYRTVLMLRDIEEMNTAEVAELLEVSENAVKIRLHRARQALATLLGGKRHAREPGAISGSPRP